jgi:iron complex transport system permease protein
VTVAVSEFAAVRRRRLAVLAGLGVVAALAVLVSVSVGTAGPPPWRLWGEVGDAEGFARELVLGLRLPRALAGLAAGALLATSGVCMQVLLRNPLADPYVLGVSGGAAIGAIGAMLAGLGLAFVQGAAFAGALAAILIVFGLARTRGGWTPTRLLLTGVVVAAGTSAIVSCLLALGEDVQLRGMLYWLMGDLSYVRRPAPLLALALAGVAAGVLAGRYLNVLTRGETQAELLGVPVRGVRLALFAGASLLTAATVPVVGSIGFVGLLTPHLVRQLVGADHRLVVPGAALLGGTLVVLADLAARTAFAPRQLPVGALTALVGVPLFLILMRRERQVA